MKVLRFLMFDFLDYFDGLLIVIMKYCFCLLLLAVLFSCNQQEDRSFEKAWMYEGEQTKEEQLENIFKYGGSMEYGFNGASFLNLQPNGNFTSYFSAFDYGNWKLKDSSLLLTDHNNGLLVLDVKKLDAKEMICLNRSNHKVYRFQGFNNSFSSQGESPFSLANNQWRIKAVYKEEDPQIQSRLKNHFKWWEKYFSWALKNKMQVLDIRSTPSVLQMYANGFELKYYDRQFPEWKTIFYDTADCWRAYEMVYYLMYQKNIKWPKTENRFEAFVSAFQQLQQWMDIDPKTYMASQDSSKMKTISRKEATEK